MSIRKMRLLHGLTQIELSDKLGLSPSVIGKWETGKLAVSADARAALCEVFKADPHATSPAPIYLVRVATEKGYSVHCGTDGQWSATPLNRPRVIDLTAEQMLRWLRSANK